MRRSIPAFLSLLVLLAWLLAGCASPRALPDAAPLRVLSFNLRVNVASDSLDAWPYRKDVVARVILDAEADLVGVQEATKPMLDTLLARLPGWAWLGVGRADGAEGGEYSAIFYRPSRFEVLAHDTFWLSETPDVPGSKSWDAAIERIATWARFRDQRSGQTFYHYNTHFDHVGVTAREESARLLARRIAALPDTAAVVVTGDFNTTDDTPAYAALTAEGLTDALGASLSEPEGPRSTWNGFREVVPDRRIDFIFVRGPLTVASHRILDTTFDGRFPSDHLPVLAVLSRGS